MKLSIAAFFAFMLSLAPACEAQVTLPTQTVYGSGGWQVICTGTDCAGIFNNIVSYSPPLIDEELVQDDPRADQFCRELAQAKPLSCNLNNPPSTPVTTPGWTSNGCGDGSFVSNNVAPLIAGLGLQGYQGNLNNPFPGTSFYTACQAHDECWGRGLSRTFCDDAFSTRLGQICGGSAYASSCSLLAGRMSTAVRDLTGNAAYANALSALHCAVWAQDMRDNGCSE
jgi:hypothetical protein